MKMPLKFWVGMALAVAGIVVMSLPDKPCVDCDDETTPAEETVLLEDEATSD